MGSTQYYVAQSLDGYIAERDGGLEWLLSYGASEGGVSEGGGSESGSSDSGVSAATDGAYDRFYAQIGALAMGSATYEWILAHVEGWPYAELPAWVFSSRGLPAAGGGADVRFVSGPVGPAHAEMVGAAGERNVWLVGGGDLASQFAEAGLLDELLVTIVPVVLGDGLPTFARRLGQRLRRTGAQPYGNGMTELRYALVR